MKVFIFRTFFTLILIIFQISFFDILFPWPQSPVFILVSVVAWTLVLGFPRSLYMTVSLTLLYDALAYGAVTWISLYSVFIAYGASFLSRRLLIEHKGMSLSLYAFFAAFSVFMYQALTPFLAQNILFSRFIENIAPAPFPALHIVSFSFVFASLLFPLTYLLLKRFEAYIESIAQKQFLNIR